MIDLCENAFKAAEDRTNSALTCLTIFSEYFTNRKEDNELALQFAKEQVVNIKSLEQTSQAFMVASDEIQQRIKAINDSVAFMQ